jgi:hypothetical protein
MGKKIEFNNVYVIRQSRAEKFYGDLPKELLEKIKQLIRKAKW